MTGTEPKNSTPVARGRSGPVRYEIVGKDGFARGSFLTAQAAAETAKSWWPDQQQDEDRTGNGWDVQVAGCEG